MEKAEMGREVSVSCRKAAAGCLRFIVEFGRYAIQNESGCLCFLTSVEAGSKPHHVCTAVCGVTMEESRRPSVGDQRLILVSMSITSGMGGYYDRMFRNNKHLYMQLFCCNTLMR